MYTVELSRTAEKSLMALPYKVSVRIVKALEALKEDPFSGKRLTVPLKGLLSIRIMSYRII